MSHDTRPIVHCPACVLQDFSDLDGVLQQRRQEMLESSSSGSQTPDYEKINGTNSSADTAITDERLGFKHCNSQELCRKARDRPSLTEVQGKVFHQSVFFSTRPRPFLGNLKNSPVFFLFALPCNSNARPLVSGVSLQPLFKTCCFKSLKGTFPWKHTSER